MYILVAVMVVLSAATGVPWLLDLYHAKMRNLSRLEADLFFQRKLRDRAERIIRRYRELPELEKKNQDKLFRGKTPEIVSSAMRTELNTIAQQHGISIISMAVPEFSIAGDWVLITQSLTFILPQGHLLGFLKALDTSTFFLPVISLDIRATEQGKIRCSMKVVGFSQLTGAD